jgi:hypothetical protein
MLADETYTGAVLAAELLRLAGHWDTALDLLGDLDTGPARRARAEALADRFWWRHLDEDATERAAAALARDDPRAADLLRGQISYTRMLFDLRPRPDDLARAERGFTAASGGWGLFWGGVLADNVLHDRKLAAQRYAEAGAHRNDALLRSYVIRHQGVHLLDDGDRDGLGLLRESLDLRIAVGARPAVAGAAAALAEFGEDRWRWRPVAITIARELRLDPLLASIGD